MRRGFGSCVGRVIREDNLVVRQDTLQGLRFQRQEFGFLEEYNVILFRKFGQGVVDVVLVVGVV